MSTQFDGELFLGWAQTAFTNASRMIRGFLLTRKGLAVQVKDFDKTIVTMADLASEEEITRIFRQAFLGVSIIREEGVDIEGNADWAVWIDPLDGTNAYALGLPTSTVIIVAYSLTQSRLLAVLIGEPAYNRIWRATHESECTRVFGSAESLCRVWDGELNMQSTVFLDVSHGFPRKTPSGPKQIFMDEGMQAFMTGLQSRTKVLIPGSNGLTHAMVANGGVGATGAITTAMGGPWDAVGVMLVDRAGGVVRAWNVRVDRQLEEVDPMNPLGFDIAISANNPDTMRVLTETLMQAWR